MTPSVQSAGGRRSGSVVTREKAIERIRRWADFFGEPPCAADWNPSVARWRAQEWRIERYRAGDPETGEPWPSLNAVKRRFGGSWDAAVRAAGLQPRRPGPARAARSAAPSVPPRAERLQAAVAAGVADDGLIERVRDAERHAAAAERRARSQARRAERLEAAAAEARLRARRAGDRARRAVAARERAAARAAADVAAASAEGERLACEADARARAADDQMHAAQEDADRARGIAAARMAGEVPAGPAGPGELADALRLASAARATGDSARLAAALADVAAAALGWRERL
jgi:hypothetical protein